MIPPRPTRSPSTTGFTLLELVVVMVLIGVLTTVGVGHLRGLRERGDVVSAARQLRDQAMAADQLAASEQLPVRLRIDLDQRTVRLTILDGSNDGRSAPTQLPAVQTWLASQRPLIAVFTASEDGRRQRDGLVDLVFLPDRRCDGAGSLELASGNTARRLTIAPGATLPTITVIAADDVEDG